MFKIFAMPLLAITIITWNTTAWGAGVGGEQIGTDDCYIQNFPLTSGYTDTNYGGKNCSASVYMCNNDKDCILSCTACSGAGELSTYPRTDMTTGCSFYTCSTDCSTTTCDTTPIEVVGWQGYMQSEYVNQSNCTCSIAYSCAEAKGYIAEGFVSCTKDATTGTISSCRGCVLNEPETPSCDEGQYLLGNSCTTCTAGYRCPGDNNRYKCTSGTYSGTGQASCTSCPQDYPYSDEETTSDSYCYASKTSTGSRLPCSTPSGCAAAECGTCTPGTCNWRDYKSATDTSCTPTDCTKPVASVTADEGYYVSGITCPACPTAYPSSDGGNIGEGSCYVIKTNTGSQVSCSLGSANVQSYDCEECELKTCNWRDYKSAPDTSCTPENCYQQLKSYTCKSGYYPEDNECKLCTVGYYCNGSVQKQCPEIKQGSGKRGTSKEGSKSENECYVPNTEPLTAEDATGTYVCLYDAYYQTGTH